MIIHNTVPVPGSLPEKIEDVRVDNQLASMKANHPTKVAPQENSVLLFSKMDSATVQPVQNASSCAVGEYIHPTGLEPVPFPKPRPRFRRRRRVPKT